MDGFHGLQADVNRLVYRCAGRCQNAGHCERQVGMVGKAGAPTPVGQHNTVASLVIELAGHAGAQHHIEQIGEPVAGCQLQGLIVAILEALNELCVSAYYPVTPVAVAQ